MTNSLIQPKISIILPVFNAAAFVAECLESILDQTFSDFEIIAVDDGSSDRSLDILETYAKSDSRIKVYRNDTNLGISKTMNKAIKLARGRYLARMDADDIMYPHRLEIEYKFLQSNPNCILVGGQVRLVDVQGQEISYKTFPTESHQIRKLMFIAMPVQHGTLMIDLAKLPKDFNWYDDTLVTGEEVDLLFRLLNYGEFGNVDEPLIDYRQHGASLTHRLTKTVFTNTYLARKRAVREYGYKPTTAGKLLCEIQRIVVLILPEKLLQPIYLKSRNMLVAISKLGNGKHKYKYIPRTEMKAAIVKSITN